MELSQVEPQLTYVLGHHTPRFVVRRSWRFGPRKRGVVTGSPGQLGCRMRGGESRTFLGLPETVRPPLHLLAECVGTNTCDSLVSWLDPGEEAGDIQFSDS